MKFEKERHVQYFAYCLQSLPAPYSALDTNRLTLVHFAVQSLDLLGVFHNDNLLTSSLRISKDAIIEWIHSLYTRVDTTNSCYNAHVGFKGGTFLGPPMDSKGGEKKSDYVGWEYDHGHIAMTYTALATLATLGDDLSRIDEQSILEGIKGLQRDDGSFQCISVGSEHDMRFLYCACAISSMLHNWSAINIPAATSYITSCKSYDGAFALIPGQEGHGGSTFCAVASLKLMGQLEHVLIRDRTWFWSLVRWCVARQIKGMQGRPNKNEDTCYSYWIGGALSLLLQANASFENNSSNNNDGEQQSVSDHLLDLTSLKEYVLSCQTDMGGFSKTFGAAPDLLHSFYSLAWLSLSNSYNHNIHDDTDGDNDDRDNISLRQLDCALGIPLDRTAIFQKVFTAP